MDMDELREIRRSNTMIVAGTRADSSNHRALGGQLTIVRKETGRLHRGETARVTLRPSSSRTRISRAPSDI